MIVVEQPIAFVVTAIASAGVTCVVRSQALRRNWLDVPNARSSHDELTPRGGGVAIAVVFVSAIVVGYLIGVPVLDDVIWAVLAGAVPVAVVGFIDDRIGLSVSARLIVHGAGVASAILILDGVTAGSGPILWALNAVAVIAGVWFLNLFNFMDGIDGLAASQAIFVSAAAWILLSVLDASEGLLFVWVCLGGTCAGFLTQNWPKAKIFMGDVGSGFLGCTLAILLFVSASVTDFSLWTGSILVSPFVADATVTLVRRIIRGDQWTSAHRSHAYQRLSRRWGSHKLVTVVFLGMDVMLVFPAALASVVAPARAPMLAAATLATLAFVAWTTGAGLPDRSTSVQNEGMLGP